MPTTAPSPPTDPDLARSVTERLALQAPRPPLAPPISAPQPESSPKERDLLSVVNLLGSEVYQNWPPAAARRLMRQPGAGTLARLAKRLRQFRGSGNTRGILALGAGPAAAGDLVIKVLVNSRRAVNLLRDCRWVRTPGEYTHAVEVQLVEGLKAQCAGVPVQGGCSIGHTPPAAKAIWGTVACRVAREDGRYYLLTSGHVFDGRNRPAGPLSHPCPPAGAAPTDIAPLSTVCLRPRGRVDAALIGPVSDALAQAGIPNIVGAPAGFRTARRGEQVRMYGAASGRVIGGTVSDTFAFALIEFSGVGNRLLIDLVSVRTDTFPQSGDSGAAWVGATDNMLLGIHTATSSAGLSLFTNFTHAATDPLLRIVPQ